MSNGKAGRDLDRARQSHRNPQEQETGVPRAVNEVTNAVNSTLFEARMRGNSLGAPVASVAQSSAFARSNPAPKV